MKKNGVLCGASLAAVCLLAIAAIPRTGGAGAPLGVDQRIQDALGVADASIQQIDLPFDAGRPFAATVELEGELVTLDLAPHSMRSLDFQLLVQVEGGELVEMEAPPVATYRGTVLEMPGSRVSASLHAGRLTAVIFSADDGPSWVIQPLSEVIPEAGAGAHVVYHTDDAALAEDYFCGADDLLENAGLGAIPDEGAGGGTANTPFRVADVAFDADFQFYQQNGSSVAATLRDIERVMDTVELVYERDTLIAYEVTVIIVRTSSGSNPYTSNDPVTLLNQFRTQWNNKHRDIPRDIAHLMTGRNLSGSVIGIAWLQVICASKSTGRGYAVSQSRFTGSHTFRVALTAHELGHNWAAGHCSGGGCHIMCAGIGGCGGIGLKFGTTAKRQIVNYKNTRGCLSDLADPISLPFFDAFETTVLDKTRWTFANGIEVNSAALGEPSQPNSVELDTPVRAFDYDSDLRSNFILLGGKSVVVLSYHTEHRGVEAGERLFVEYWNNNLTWVEINRLTSDGVDQNEFELHSHVLQSDAYHNEFRLRFRTIVDQRNDHWYIDDIEVTDNPANLFDLTIDSTPIRFVKILISPKDVNGKGNGLTPQTRRYFEDTAVTLTALEESGGFFFSEWRLDGEFATKSLTLVFDVTADADALAVYVANPGETVLPDSFEVTRGVLLRGDLADLFDSDDSYVVVDPRRPSDVTAASGEIVVTGISPSETPAELKFTLEAAAPAMPLRQRIELFNYDTQDWEQVDERDSPQQDTVVEVSIRNNAPRFVQAGSGEIKARIGFVDFDVSWAGWRVRYDQVFWVVVE